MVVTFVGSGSPSSSAYATYWGQKQAARSTFQGLVNAGRETDFQKMLQPAWKQREAAMQHALTDWRRGASAATLGRGAASAFLRSGSAMIGWAALISAGYSVFAGASGLSGYHPGGPGGTMAWFNGSIAGLRTHPGNRLGYSWWGQFRVRVAPNLLPATLFASPGPFTNQIPNSNYAGVYLAKQPTGSHLMTLDAILHAIQAGGYSGFAGFMSGEVGGGGGWMRWQNEKKTSRGYYNRPWLAASPLLFYSAIPRDLTIEVPTKPGPAKPPPGGGKPVGVSFRWGQMRRRPEKGKQEKKYLLNGRVAAAMNATTEGLDFLGVLFAAANGPSGLSFPDRMRWLFLEGGFENITVDSFIDAYWENWREDRFWGRTSKIGNRSYRQFLDQYGSGGRPFSYGAGPVF